MHFYFDYVIDLFNYYYGTRMAYIGIQVNTTIDGATLGFPDGLEIRDAWEDFVSAEVIIDLVFEVIIE